MIFHARPSCLMFYTWPHRRFRLYCSNLPASSWPSFVKKKNYTTISWLKIRRNRNFHEVFILFLSFLYSLFWFLFHSSHSAVILKNFHWSLSKIAFFASEVMSEKTCKLLPLINIHADLFSFCLNWRHCTRKTTENNGFPSGVQSSWAMEDLLVLH